MNSNGISLIIADDHKMFREGIKRLFATVDDIEILADTDNGDDLIRLIEQHAPTVALVDVFMPGPGISGVTDAVEAMDRDCYLIALTMHLEPSFARQLLENGLAGYVIKDAAFDELLDAVRSVAQGDGYLSPRIVNAKSGDTELTPREFACLKAAAKGATGKHIAKDLSITERTVRFHLANVCRKLGVQRRSEAVAKAWETGMLG